MADHTDWDEHFPFIQHALRTSIIDTLGETPYFLVHVRNCPDFADTSLLPPSKALKSPHRTWIQTLLLNLKTARELAAERQLRARDKLLHDYIHKHGFKLDIKQYTPGDFVMIRNYVKDRELKDAADSLRPDSEMPLDTKT